jgi:hypothetical protein
VNGSIPLAATTRAAWRSLFDGQDGRVRGLLEPVRAELASIPEGAIWNGWFESGDAELYYALLRATRPERVLELGCGFSSGFAARALERNGRGSLTCIDPSPRVDLPGNARFIQAPWQEADPELFRALGPGDVLFIDSSHEAEEALAIYLLLDLVPEGVIVHHHDILYPHPPRFPEENLVISYYALRRTRWTGVAALALLHHELGPERFVELFPSSARAPWRSPGSVWLRKTAR